MCTLWVFRPNCLLVRLWAFHTINVEHPVRHTTRRGPKSSFRCTLSPRARRPFLVMPEMELERKFMQRKKNLTMESVSDLDVFFKNFCFMIICSTYNVSCINFSATNLTKWSIEVMIAIFGHFSNLSFFRNDKILYCTVVYLEIVHCWPDSAILLVYKYENNFTGVLWRTVTSICRFLKKCRYLSLTKAFRSMNPELLQFFWLYRVMSIL